MKTLKIQNQGCTWRWNCRWCSYRYCNVFMLSLFVFELRFIHEKTQRIILYSQPFKYANFSPFFSNLRFGNRFLWRYSRWGGEYNRNKGSNLCRNSSAKSSKFRFVHNRRWWREVFAEWSEKVKSKCRFDWFNCSR